MVEKQHYLYVTENLINGKKYVGQHITRCNNLDAMYQDGYLGSGVLLINAIKKYGRDNFSKKIIAVYSTQKEVDRAEIAFIKSQRVLENKGKWYNRAAGGQFGRSDKHSDLMSQIMSNPDVQIRIKESKIKNGVLKSEEEKEIQKLYGMRIHLINTIRRINNIKKREYFKSEEGRKFLSQYRYYFLKDKLKAHNEWQRTELGKAAMKEALRDVNRKEYWSRKARINAAKNKLNRVSLKYFHLICLNNNILPGEVSDKFPSKYGNGKYKTIENLSKACDKIENKFYELGIEYKEGAMVEKYTEHFNIEEVERSA